MTCSSIGALLNRLTRSGAVGHVAAVEPTSIGRRGSKPHDVWQRVDAHHIPCLDLQHVYMISPTKIGIKNQSDKYLKIEGVI
jgi:hypothetical protein